jgi:hypothetical protein
MYKKTNISHEIVPLSAVIGPLTTDISGGIYQQLIGGDVEVECRDLAHYKGGLTSAK